MASDVETLLHRSSVSKVAPSLGTMPFEIIAMICRPISNRSTLAKLARLNLPFFNVATRILWQQTKFKLGEWEQQDSIFVPCHVLRGIAVERRSVYRRYIQHLDIRLSPSDSDTIRDDLKLISQSPQLRLRDLSIRISNPNIPDDIIDSTLTIMASQLLQNVEKFACTVENSPYRTMDLRPLWLLKFNPLRLPSTINVKRLDLSGLDIRTAIEIFHHCPVVKSFVFRPMGQLALSPQIDDASWGQLFDALAQTKSLKSIDLHSIDDNVSPPNGEGLVEAEWVKLRSVPATGLSSILARFNLEKTYGLTIKSDYDTERLDGLQALATYSGVSNIRCLDVKILSAKVEDLYDPETDTEFSGVTLPADLLIGITTKHPMMQHLDFDGVYCYYMMTEITDDVIRKMSEAAPNLQDVSIAIDPRTSVQARKAICKSFKTHFPDFLGVWWWQSPGEPGYEEELSDEGTDEEEYDLQAFDELTIG